MVYMDKGQPGKDGFERYRWLTLLGFALMYGFLYTGRFNMELALPLMDKDLGLTKTQIQWIASAMYWSYGFGNFINGRLGEIYGHKRVIMTGILLSVVTNWIVSVSPSPTIIGILWGVNGYFQSMVWAPGIGLIARWWTSNKRGFAAGFAHFFSGVAHMVLNLTVMFSGWIVPEWGWRGFFRIPVGFLLIISFVFYFLSKGAPHDVGLSDFVEEDPKILIKEDGYRKIEKEKGMLFPYKCLFSQWKFCGWCLIAALSNISRYGLLMWIPLYYAQKMNLEVNTGIFSGFILPLGMALGTFIVPWTTDLFFRKKRAPVVIICGALSGLMVFMFPSMETVTTAAISIFWCGFFLYGINGVVWAYAMDVGTRVFAGTAAGVLDWAAYMGAAVQGVVFGYILHVTGNWIYVFASIALMCILIVILAIAVYEQESPAEESLE